MIAPIQSRKIKVKAWTGETVQFTFYHKRLKNGKLNPILHYRIRRFVLESMPKGVTIKAIAKEFKMKETAVIQHLARWGFTNTLSGSRPIKVVRFRKRKPSAFHKRVDNKTYMLAENSLTNERCVASKPKNSEVWNCKYVSPDGMVYFFTSDQKAKIIPMAKELSASYWAKNRLDLHFIMNYYNG